MLDVDKLKFEYLKDNELHTDYLYNIDLQSKYTEKPYEMKIDYKSFKDTIYHSKIWKAQKTKTYQIKKIDYS